MNYYFLLEDEKSFIKVLPLWLEYMEFPCKRVADIKYVTQNTYILQSGQGVTQLITKVLFDTINTILSDPNKIDNLVIILDAEELESNERKTQVLNKIIEKYGGLDLGFEINVLVSNSCFETWLLGGADLYPDHVIDVSSDFFEYYNHYDIQKNDPEMMKVPANCSDTTAKYHFHYLHEVFRYNKIRYNKKKPDYVSTFTYFEGLNKRVNNTSHIASLREFIDFVEKQNIK